MEWVSILYEKVSREIVALDGKTVRRSKGTSKKLKPIHVVSAWANTNKLVLGQLKVNEKSNEITAIPELLKLLDTRFSTTGNWKKRSSGLLSINRSTYLSKDWQNITFSMANKTSPWHPPWHPLGIRG